MRPLPSTMQHDWLERLKDEARLLGEARMLRDETPYTTDIHQQIVERFRALMNDLGKSDAWAAKSLGISSTTLSEVLSARYAGDIEQHIRRIDKWIDQQVSRQKAAKPGEWVGTSTAKAIIGVGKIAMAHNRLVVIYGPSGCGKTLTSQYLVSEHPGAIYVSINAATRREGPLLAEMCKQLRMGNVKLTLAQMQEAVIDVLRDSNRLIIVDEVHALVTGKVKEEQTLTMLRQMQEATGCPMIWMATADLWKYLTEGTGGVRQGVDQIYGRVFYWLDLTTAIAHDSDGDPGHHTVEDIRKLVANRQMRLAPGADEELRSVANTAGMGGLRTVDTILRLAASYYKVDLITVDLVKDIQKDRLGRFAANAADARVQQRRRKTA